MRFSNIASPRLPGASQCAVSASRAARAAETSDELICYDPHCCVLGMLGFWGLCHVLCDLKIADDYTHLTGCCPTAGKKRPGACLLIFPPLSLAPSGRPPFAGPSCSHYKPPRCAPSVNRAVIDQQQRRGTSTFDHDHQHNLQLSSWLLWEQLQNRCGDQATFLRHRPDEAFERPSSFLCWQHPKTMQGAIVVVMVDAPGNNQRAIPAAAAAHVT